MLIDSFNARMRNIIKTLGRFPEDEATTKLIWLVPRNIKTDWNRSS
jgi:putative transposase